MKSDNPYSAPLETPHPIAADSKPGRSFGEIARATFLAWEKLRVFYVMALVVGTCLGAAFEFPSDWAELILVIFAGAITANVAYFAGPIIETYVTWLGYRGTWLRKSLFVAGTLFAFMLSVGTVATL